MSRNRTHAVRCPDCGSIIPIKIYDSITPSVNPELRQRILDGKFEIVVCPDCRAVLYIQYDILYHDTAGKFMVCVGKDYSDMIQQLDCPAGYKLRYVDDYRQLAEKIRIFEAGLSDEIMEITKEAMRHMAKKNLELYYAKADVFYSSRPREAYSGITRPVYAGQEILRPDSRRGRPRIPQD